jgi:DNA-binding transcriptional ArsR family regulator
MAYDKREHFSEIEQKAAVFAKALSHPARVAILLKLAGENKCMCGDIVDVIPLAQSTVSQHLKELKEAGLVQGEIEGPKTCYCINWDKLEEEFEDIQKLFEELKLNKSTIKCC